MDPRILEIILDFTTVESGKRNSISDQASGDRKPPPGMDELKKIVDYKKSSPRFG